MEGRRWVPDHRNALFPFTLRTLCVMSQCFGTWIFTGANQRNISKLLTYQIGLKLIQILFTRNSNLSNRSFQAPVMNK